MTARVLLGVAAWLLLALLAGASGSLAGLRPPFPQAILVGLTLALLALFRWSLPVRTWALTVDIRALVLLHVTRFVGLYFLVLHARGMLPWAFAVPGGWGDIAVAAAALGVALGAPRRGAVGWALYAAWNLAGLVDILLVVATAARLAVAEPGSMRALTVLPLSLLPTFLVPLVIATHVVIWLGSPRAGGRGTGRSDPMVSRRKPTASAARGLQALIPDQPEHLALERVERRRDGRDWLVSLGQPLQSLQMLDPRAKDGNPL